MIPIEENLHRVKQKIAEAALRANRSPDEISLVAVTKGQPLKHLQVLYDLGVRDFGENRVDEALQKMEALPSDIRWHFIGKLQRNKVAKVIGRFHLLHSVDTLPLAEKIAKLSQERDLKTPILLEVNTSGEKSKEGWSFEEFESVYPALQQLEEIEIQGLMTLAPLTSEGEVVCHCFRRLKELACAFHLPVLSMGMTNDFPWAIQEGATIVRIGSALYEPLRAL